MDFIIAPLIIGIITLGIYGLFELYARRQERLAIIEKMGEKLDPSLLGGSVGMSRLFARGSSFGALKGGCLLMGIGLGLLIGFLICSAYIDGYTMPDPDVNNYKINNIASIVYGSCVLLCGGIGLITAFLLEFKYSRKKEN